VKENWDEAARWYQKSAMQDDEYGMFSLGRAYQFGIGVLLDLNTAITWYDKAAAKGHGQAAYFAKYLRDNHGVDGSSRTPEEQAMLGPLIQRMVLTAPPLGHTFHSSAERVAYIRAVAQDEALRKAQMFWNMKKDEYDSCRRAGADNCHPPGPPPK
jgi:TPR repeat protein